MELDRTERRILGSLVEKRWTTPDQYPLSLNALVAACNQKSNRDPKLTLEVFEIEGALLALRARGLVFTREKDGGRVIRYDERLSEKLGIDRLGTAVIAELMLRGPQTAPELFRRASRMASFTDADQAMETIRSLGAQGLTRLLTRQSGQRHARWTHLLAPEAEAPPAEESEPAEAPVPGEAQVPREAPAPEPPPAAPREKGQGLAERVAALEEEVAELRERLGRLEDRSGSPPETPPTSAAAPGGAT